MSNERLREQMARKGLTYDQTARLSGVSMWTIKECVRIGYLPTIRTAWKIANALGSTPEELGLVRLRAACEA